MAEGDGLENRYTRKGIKGSNPLLSAKYCLPAGLVKYFSCVPICGVEQWLRALLAPLESSDEDYWFPPAAAG